MDYNEYDDYGTGWEEQAEAMWEQMIDSQVREILDSCECVKAGTDASLTALLTGRCAACGWREKKQARRGFPSPPRRHLRVIDYGL